MRVAVEASAVLGVECGLRTFTVELLRQLCEQNPRDEYLFYVARWKAFPPQERAWPSGPRPENLGMHLRRFPFAPMLYLEHGLGLPIQEALLLPRVDVFHGAGQFLPRLRRIPSVLTVQHWQDLRYNSGAFMKFYYTTVYEQSIRWADRLIVVSEFTKRYLNERFQIPLERMRVVPHGIFSPVPILTSEEIAAARAKWSLPSRFVLCLSRMNRGKNTLRLVRAFRAVASRHKDVSLVLAGNADADYLPEVLAAVADCGLAGRVVLTGSVPEKEVPAFYAACEAFVFPSTSEGFGIPLVEAMAMGAPIAASTATSIPEVVGDAGLLFDPLDEEAITGALLELLENESRRRELSARGRTRAARYTWAEAARATRAVYAEVA